jgi:hypothetical protein
MGEINSRDCRRDALKWRTEASNCPDPKIKGYMLILADELDALAKELEGQAERRR